MEQLGRNAIIVNYICVNMLPVEEVGLLDVAVEQEPRSSKLGPCSVATNPLVSGEDFGLEPFLLEHLNVPASFNLFLIKVSPPVPPQCCRMTSSSAMAQSLCSDGPAGAVQRRRRRRAARPSSVTFYKFLADCAAEHQPAV